MTFRLRWSSHETDEFADGFEDDEIRKKFVVKVYALLSVQLFLTYGLIMMIMFVEQIRAYLFFDVMISSVAFVLGFIIYFILICYKCARRNVPLNFILLTLMSICYGVGFGILSTRYATYIIAAAFGVTAAIVLLLTIVSAMPCFDTTGCGIYLCLTGLIVSLIGTLLLLFGYWFKMKIVFLIYSGIMVILFSFYLVYDTQMILGGRRYELDPEEYIFGVVCLYIDIMYIFVYIMQIFGFPNT